jgi:hypothetical protein
MGSSADHAPAPPPDFTESAPALESVRPARAGADGPRPLRLFSCGCGPQFLRRIHRAWWMRLLPGFGQYLCLRCDQRVLRPRLRQQWFFDARPPGPGPDGGPRRRP